jgi:hypothetical protein
MIHRRPSRRMKKPPPHTATEAGQPGGPVSNGKPPAWCPGRQHGRLSAVRATIPKGKPSVGQRSRSGKPGWAAFPQVLIQVIAGALAVVIGVAVAGAFASRRVAERESVTEAAHTTDLLAQQVVQPAITDGLISGRPVLAWPDRSAGLQAQVAAWPGRGAISCAGCRLAVQCGCVLAAICRCPGRWCRGRVQGRVQEAEDVGCPDAGRGGQALGVPGVRYHPYVHGGR